MPEAPVVLTNSILVALSREAQIVKVAIGGRMPEVAIAITGMGPVRARLGAQRQLAAGATVLLSVGFAGALRAPLGVGDLLLSREVVDSTGHRYAADASMHSRLRRSLCAQYRTHDVVLLSAAHVVGSVADKNALGARFDVAVVDMESAVIAAVACDAGVPFAALRVVCDGPSQRIPICTKGALDAGGCVIIARLGSGLVLRPWKLFELGRLGITAAYAGRLLKRTLQCVFDGECAHTM